jgi:hypothetical protein
MFARVTLLEIDTLRSSVDDALALYRDTVMPKLREQPGYRGVYAMSTPEGQAAIITFWEGEEQAAEMNSGGFYSQVLGQFATLFKAPPGRAYYQVLLADMPAAVS